MLYDMGPDNDLNETNMAIKAGKGQQGQQRPTTADKGQQWPTNGQQWPAKAGNGRQKAGNGQQRSAMANKAIKVDKGQQNRHDRQDK